MLLALANVLQSFRPLRVTISDVHSSIRWSQRPPSISLGGSSTFLPHGLTELIIAEDDDAEGAAAAARAVAAYARDGLTIRRMPPPRPAGLKGPNDWATIP